MFTVLWYPIGYQSVNQELAVGQGSERFADFVHSSFGERGDSLVKQLGVKHGETVECRHAIDVYPIGNGQRNCGILRIVRVTDAKQWRSVRGSFRFG
jgi:hypothetical protein